MAHHPDRQVEAGATERLKQINASFAVLTDPTLREAFDRGLKVEPPQLEELGGLTAQMGSIVDGLFGIRDERPVNGRHYRYDLTLSFETACLGGEVELSLPVEEDCPSCEGRGFPLESLPTICPTCKGASNGSLDVTSKVSSSPSTCGGRSLIDVSCESCGGSGARFESLSESTSSRYRSRRATANTWCWRAGALRGTRW